LKKLLIKNLQKKKNNKKNGAKIWQEKTRWGWKKKETIIANKKITIKRIRTNLERLKNHRGVKLKIFCNMIYYLYIKKWWGWNRKTLLRANPIESNRKKITKKKVKKRELDRKNNKS